MNGIDQLTADIAADLIKMFDIATKNEDIMEMNRIMDIASKCPNKPLKREVMRQLTEEV